MQPILRACFKRRGAGGCRRGGALHRYSNSSSAYFSEYSISWLMAAREARGQRRRCSFEDRAGLRACSERGGTQVAARPSTKREKNKPKSMSIEAPGDRWDEWLHYPPRASAREHESRHEYERTRRARLLYHYTMRITAYKVAVERSGPMRSGSMGPGDVTSHRIRLMSGLMTRGSASLLWPDGRQRERDA